MVHFDLQTELKPKKDHHHGKPTHEFVLFWKVVAAVAVILLLMLVL